MTEMGRILALVEIGRAAVETDRVREACAEAKGRRHGYDRCEQVEQWHGKPCWKDWTDYGEGDVGLPDESEWCQYCLGRQEAHEQYVKLRNKLGGMRAGLARRCMHYRVEKGEAKP